MAKEVYQRRTGGPEVIVLKYDETHVTLRNEGQTKTPDFVLPRRTFEEDFLIVRRKGR